jgi:hypothetical protein
MCSASGMRGAGLQLIDVDMVEAPHGRAQQWRRNQADWCPDCLVFSYQGDGIWQPWYCETLHAANRVVLPLFCK